MSFVYTRALGLLNSTVLTGDIRALLVMSDSTAAADEDAEFIADFGTLDEYDGADYVRVACTGETFAVDAGNDRFRFATNPITFAGIGVGTRQCVGMVLFLFVTNDAASKPLIYVDGAGFPFDGNGLDVTWTPHSSGVMYIRNAV